MRVWAAVATALIALIISAFLVKEESVHTTLEQHHRVHETILNPEDAISRFARTLTVPAIADKHAKENHVSNPAPFHQLVTLLKQEYPAAWKHMDVKIINQFSLLFTWRGSDPSLRPLVLISHLDVVPAPDRLPHSRNWTHPPFTGTVDEEFVWGRGALDTKVTVAGPLEAACQILQQNSEYTPARTVYFAFGHDEEVGGDFGAAAIVKELAARGVHEVELVLDEGGAVLNDNFKVKQGTVAEGPFALVATAEKGYQTWRIKVEGVAGHSSIPPTGQGTSTAARIARILLKLESQQTATRLASPTTEFLKGISVNAKWAPLRTLLGLADHPLVNPILGQVIGASGARELEAVVRMTVAPVVIKAEGIAGNVLPPDGMITLNIRTLPGDDVESVRKYLDVILQKESAHATAELVNAGNPATPVSSSSGPEFNLVAQAIQETFTPEGNGARSLPVVPYLMTGGTDSKHYIKLAPGRIFRFSPLVVTFEDMGSIHGVDERIRKENYLDAVRFYMRFLKLAAGDDGGAAK